jgi:hypothetical protein
MVYRSMHIRTWANDLATRDMEFIIISIKIIFSLIIISSAVTGGEYFPFEGDEGAGWTNHITPSWHLDTDEHHLGMQSLKSGSIIIGDNRIDTISRRNRGFSKSGNVSFWWKTNITSNKGKLSFYVNNIELCSCISDKWGKAGPFDFNGGDKIEWRATRDTDKKDLIGNGWIDDICIRYDDDSENCCLSDNIDGGTSSPVFKNESFAPSAGSLLSPFRFEIEVENLASIAEPAIIELQIKNESNGILETQKLLEFNEFNNKIMFDNIRFISPGCKKYRFFYGSHSSEEYNGPKVEPLIVNITPSEGSNLNSYTYSIDRPESLAENISEISLEIKDPGSSEWKSVGIGRWNTNNITFYVPSFNFCEPRLGEIEFRFRTNYGILGPFWGPYIFINYKNIQSQPDSNLVTSDVRSDRCGESVCLSINGMVYEQNYMACPNWENIEWRNIMFDGDNFKIRSCR